MNYEEMSDFEVNSYVSMYIHGFSWIEFDDEFHGHVKCGNERSHGFAMVEVSDYCNNPSDAWPIISRNLIGTSPDEDGVTCHFYGDWTARAFCSQICCTHKNPLRAAMIVFLMMNEQ